MLDLSNYPDILTIKEVAEILNVTEQTVYNYIDQPVNNLPVIKLTAMSYRVYKASLIEWLDARQTAAKIVCKSCGEEITGYDSEQDLLEGRVSGNCQACIEKDYAVNPS